MADGSSMGHLVNRAARLFRQLADQRLEPLGLSAGQLPVLTALMANETMSQKALTEHAAIEQPTMAATLSRMERDGIIERQPDPNDKRSYLFTLTKATRNRVAPIRSVIESMNIDALAALPAVDRKRFRQMLQTIIASLEEGLGG